MRSLLVVGLFGALCLLVPPTPARAGGFEYPAPGTRALGRGGAFYARADDPMALLYNPANLASLSGPQLMLNSHIAFFGACYQREGQYTEAVSTTIFEPGYEGQPFPEVCNDGPVGPSPNLAFAMPLMANLGIGFGVVAPAAIGHTVWGSEDGTVRVDGRRLPSPVRYALVEEQLVIVYPTVGVGYRPLPWLQLGASFQWGLGSFEYTNFTRSLPGEEPDQDVRSELSARDYFIPAVIGSVHLIPHDNVDVALSFRWVQQVEADADVTLVTGAFGTGEPGSYVPTENEYPNATLETPQPWQLALGLRYADRISPRPDDPAQVERLSGRVEDSMSNERWDVELDIVYERTSKVDELAIHLPPGSVAIFNEGDGGSMELPIPPDVPLPHNWSDQLSVRLGGDFNVIPGMAAVRAGVSYETRGVDERYMSINFWPVQRYGAHLGLTVRLGRFDISLAYAHIFQETIEVSADEAELRQISAVKAGDVEGDRPFGFVINPGTYESNFDVLSLGVNWHI